MNRRDPLAPPVDEDAVPARPPRRARKRVRMGQAAALAGRAGAPSAGPSTVSELEGRERREKAKALLEGGRSKGEAKGYGATAGARKAPGP